MDKHFADLEFVKIYLDNLLIISQTIIEYLRHLEIVLQQLNSAELTINTEKSQFFKSEIKYLGFHISKESFRLISKRVKAIINIVTPKNRR